MQKLMLKLLCGASLGLAAASGAATAASVGSYQHVLLISIDGMHAVDLQNFIARHPASALANLAAHGVRYPNALTTGPSDSFPGLVSLVTGGNPLSGQVFYDVSYDRTLFAPGSNCQGLPGTQPAFDESIDYDLTRWTGGGTPGKVLSQINPANLPMGLVNGVCKPVYPHDFMKVNTMFEVIKAAGMRTAWSDKHPAYDIVNGPSGAGVDDLYAVEVDSNDAITGQDTTLGYHSIERNDERKVDAILNEINGMDSTGKQTVGIPAVFGMNFQSVSIGEKLAVGNSNDPADAGLVGGYADALGARPNNGLELGMEFVDKEIGQMVKGLNAVGHANDTLIIVTAKHGQSPIDIATRVAVDDSPYAGTPGIGAFSDDDEGLVWLAPQSQKTSYAAARAYLLSQAGPLHIDHLIDRAHMKGMFLDPFHNSRTPDFIAITTPGVIYTGGTKLAEHGGFAENDRNVAMLVSSPAIAPAIRMDNVETRQVAPTILKALGLNPGALMAVKIENTRTLPGL